MIYHSLSDLVIGCIYSFVYGIISAGIYISQNVIITWITKILKIPIDAFHNKENSKKKRNNRLSLKEGISDLIFFVIFGLGYILLQYIALDGAFRIFFLIIFLLGFFISKKTIGLLIKIALNFIFKLIYEVIFYIYKLFSSPIYFLFKVTFKLLKPLFDKAFRYVIKRKNKKVLKNELFSIKKILKQI